MDVLFYLGPLPPILLILRGTNIWLWLRRLRPDDVFFRALCYFSSTVCLIAGVLLFSGLWIGRFWYLRSSSEICGGEVVKAPESSYFPLQHTCYLTDGSVVTLVPGLLSLIITISLVLALVSGIATSVAPRLGKSPVPSGRPDRHSE